MTVSGWVVIRCGTILDEHLAVDADRCEDGRWLQTADVLYGSELRSRERAARWLQDILTRFAACAVAATPLPGGLWAARCRKSGRVLYVVAPPEAPVGSYLHCWTAAGMAADDWARHRRRGCPTAQALRLGAVLPGG